MTAMSNETLLREDICRFGRSLFERGLTPGSSGNISVRLDGGGWLVTKLSSNMHDRSTEAAMTGAFVYGPALALIAFIVGFVRSR